MAEQLLLHGTLEVKIYRIDRLHQRGRFNLCGTGTVCMIINIVRIYYDYKILNRIVLKKILAKMLLDTITEIL